MEDKYSLIQKCAARGVKMLRNAGKQMPRGSQTILAMDLSAISDRFPLDFAKLAGANAHDFAHDIYEVRSKWTRETGALAIDFAPLCAA